MLLKKYNTCRGEIRNTILDACSPSETQREAASICLINMKRSQMLTWGGKSNLQAEKYVSAIFIMQAEKREQIFVQFSQFLESKQPLGMAQFWHNVAHLVYSGLMPVLAGFDLLGLFINCFKKGRKTKEMKNINCAVGQAFPLNGFQNPKVRLVETEWITLVKKCNQLRRNCYWHHSTGTHSTGSEESVRR